MFKHILREVFNTCSSALHSRSIPCLRSLLNFTVGVQAASFGFWRRVPVWLCLEKLGSRWDASSWASIDGNSDATSCATGISGGEQELHTFENLPTLTSRFEHKSSHSEHMFPVWEICVPKKVDLVICSPSLQTALY